ncbi:MAG: hypothetical protein ABR991_10720, partial [Terracidiphilus sp.]
MALAIYTFSVTQKNSAKQEKINREDSLKQEQSTRSAQTALDASKRSLETVTGQLNEQNAIQTENLKAAKMQEKLLD